jgi:hypothetical protein
MMIAMQCDHYFSRAPLRRATRKMTVYVLAASFMVEASKWRQKELLNSQLMVHTPRKLTFGGVPRVATGTSTDGKLFSRLAVRCGVDGGIWLAPGGHFPQKDLLAKESNQLVNTVKAMGACGSKDAEALVDAPIKESPPPAKAPVVVEKKKEPEKVEPQPEETEENPGYEVPAMVSFVVSVFVFVFELF